jgi:uncharacterized protein (TIGR04222 family)
MNPFDWTGPEFLGFYLVLSITLITAQVWLRRMREVEAYVPANTPKLTDPYLVAYLAGGANGLIRCVAVSLLERKMLIAPGGKGKESEVVFDPTQAPLLESPLEGAVARLFDRNRPAFDIFNELVKASQVTAVGQVYQTSLEAAGLLPNKEQRSTNWKYGLAVAGILAATAAVKVFLALERGHHNIAFLILLGAAASIVSLVVSRSRLTQPGRNALADLKQLLGGLKSQTKSGAFANVSPSDVAFVAAVFGVSALGGSRGMYAKNLFPGSASSNGSGCGSSSSSDGGSGSSGCGGGSGCGGCGGS